MTNLSQRTVVTNLGGGVFGVGEVRLDKRARTVSFPASANMERGMVEFLLCTHYGRTHESVLRTEVEPFQIHLAMLLLHPRKSTTPAPDYPRAGADGPTERPYAKAIEGDPVEVEVSWKLEGREVRRRAEELVLNVKTGKAMDPGPWTYNGSFVRQGVFAAQIGGTVISVIREPGSLVNNPREGSDDDEIWTVNTNAVPEVNTPVTVTLRLPSGDPP